MTNDAPNQAFVGAVLGGRYRITRVLSSGGMGAVYVAEQLGLGREVAVKVMHPFLSEDDEALVRFEREARAVAGLGHPNIVQVLDFHRAPGELAWIAMELVSGSSLSALIKSEGAFSPERAVGITLQILSALELAHGAGVVHRDLKPSNVMISVVPGRAETARLVDFGIAKLMDGTGYTRLTRTGMVLGTPQYMAPEQARGEALDGRADLYSVGVILYTMLTGISPFRGGSVADVLHAVLETMPPVPSAVRSGTPLGLDAFVARAIAKRADDRFASAREMARELARAVRTETRAAMPVSQPTPSVPTLEPHVKNRGAIYLAVATVFALLVALAAAAVAIVITNPFDLLGATAPRRGAAAPTITPRPLAPSAMAPTAVPVVAAPEAVPANATMRQYLAHARSMVDGATPGARLTLAVGYCAGWDGRVAASAAGHCGWLFTFQVPGAPTARTVTYFNPVPRQPFMSESSPSGEEAITSEASLVDSDVALMTTRRDPVCASLTLGIPGTSIVYRHDDSHFRSDVFQVMLQDGDAGRTWSGRLSDGRIERIRADCR